MGCADPPSKGVGAPHQCSRVNEQRSGWGKSSLAFFVKLHDHCSRYNLGRAEDRFVLLSSICVAVAARYNVLKLNGI